MNQDSVTLENQLRSLAPCSLDQALLDRLDAAANNSLTELSNEEMQLEKQLRQFKPMMLDADFLNQLEKITRQAPFPLNQKIVVFPQANPAKKAAIGHRPFWATAAAMALLGSAAALMMPSNSERNTVSGNFVRPSTMSAASSGIQPASYQSNVQEIHDDGVYWKSNSQPHQVLRLTHLERMTLNQENGRTVEVEQPRVQYLLVPARTD
ncbi:MAG: hypothetical protein EAZ42_10050 [Verrucomicrobia bacterium]|nr:MAG: hypothetical protein EAZ42_10050 [Verrucomicrobiota bacterium]